MVVRTYKRDTIVNMDNVLEVVLQGEIINAIPSNNTFAITLGHYRTAEDAEAIFEMLVMSIENKEDRFVMPTGKIDDV